MNKRKVYLCGPIEAIPLAEANEWRKKATKLLSDSCEILDPCRRLHTFEMKQMKSFHSAGINRLSLGIQSLDNEGLAFLGRAHSVDEACKALEQALGLFERVSADLIYGD